MITHIIDANVYSDNEPTYLISKNISLNNLVVNNLTANNLKFKDLTLNTLGANQVTSKSINAKEELFIPSSDLNNQAKLFFNNSIDASGILNNKLELQVKDKVYSISGNHCVIDAYNGIVLNEELRQCQTGGFTVDTSKYPKNGELIIKHRDLNRNCFINIHLNNSLEFYNKFGFDLDIISSFDSVENTFNIRFFLETEIYNIPELPPVISFTFNSFLV